MLNRIDRYVFRTTFGAFLLILITLTIVIWITHALREIDLITNQGQTVLIFLSITGLLIPILALVIAPIAFVIAVVYAIDKLNADSEIIVMAAAGISPWQLFRPFFVVAIVVAGLVGFISAYLAPTLQRAVRDRFTAVRADLVNNIIQPGRFLTIDGGLTFHVRERRLDGELAGILIDDRRIPSLRSTLIAEQGRIVNSGGGTFLLLDQGNIQRFEPGNPDLRIILFDRYAFDLSQFTHVPSLQQPTYLPPRERYLWELLDLDPNDPLLRTQSGQFRAELNDRLMAPIYPVIFVVIAFAMVGAPHTSRQSRGFAIGAAVISIAAVRLIGFACTVFSVQTPAALPVLYGSALIACALSLLGIRKGLIIQPPAFFKNCVSFISAQLSR